MDFKQLQAVYKNKKVLITGHTGFKGSWLLQWLHLLGAKIKGYALDPEYEEGIYNLIKGDSLCDSVIANILEKKKFEETVLSFEPDFIFHLAAQPLVRLSYEFPSETFAVNVLGTAHVLDAVKKLKKPCAVILITTDKVYENKEWVYPYRENDRLGGSDPYSASKACAELVISSYSRSFFDPNNYNYHLKAIASTRAGNVIGGGDWAKDRIIPDIVKSLALNKAVIIRNPTAIRPWQHVLEPLAGYLQLGIHLYENPVKYSGAWNFGPSSDDNKQVIDIVQTAIKIWGHGHYEIQSEDNPLHETSLLKLDISKTTSFINWNPVYNSTEAVEATMEWYKKFVAKDDMKKITIEQIHSYAARIS
jgi:CDP-glucose 4,6-dehydratase